MHCGGIQIEDTFAEAFGMWAARLVVTAQDAYWLEAAVTAATGYASSVIGCDAEAGLECWLEATQTPDGRPGAALLFFGFKRDKLAHAVANRMGQCVMTCPTTAVYDGLPEVTVEADRYDLGQALRFFGDGYQLCKVIAGRRYWRVPVMEGEFLVEASAGMVKGVAGGNVLLCGERQVRTLAAARRAVEAVAPLAGVITPFAGGVVRSGSKVGSRYKGLVASTHEAYCPTLAGQVESKVPQGASCVYEIIFDGLSREVVADAMKQAIVAACSQPGDLVAITAGNYQGKLGGVHLSLRDVMEGAS